MHKLLCIFKNRLFSPCALSFSLVWPCPSFVILSASSWDAELALRNNQIHNFRFLSGQYFQCICFGSPAMNTGLGELLLKYGLLADTQELFII